MSKRVADMTPAERERENARSRACQRARRAADPTKMRAWERAWRAANPDKAREKGRRQHIRKRFGLTVEQYDTMFAAQAGACAVCERPFAGQTRRPHIDHDHQTGRVRALLCRNCNIALGLLRESPAIMRKLAAYVEHHGAPT